MPIYRASILKDLIKEKNLVVKAFEKQLGYSNGGLAKAIEDNSKLKQDKVDRLFSIFPELNPRWLLDGSEPMFLETENAQSSTEEPGIEYKTDDFWARIDRTVQAAIEAAQAATAAAQAATATVHLVMSQMQRSEGRLEASETMIQALQEFVTVRFAENENTSRQEVGAALGKTVIQIAEQRKKGTQSEAGI